MNEDLQELHDTLLAQHQALSDQLDQTDDPDMGKTIVTEMQEVLHRIDLVQGLLFRESTTALQKKLKKVDDASAQLTEDLKEAESATELIKSVSAFLTVVDDAIDLAKTLAVA